MRLFYLPLLVCINIIQRCEGDGICKDVTVSNCDLEDGSLIDSLYALDSIMCQDLCHSFSNCHFFRFDKSSSEENCQLLESSYRETCKLVAAPIYRDVNVCLTSTDETCDKIIEETCVYLGAEIYTTPPGSTLDSDACDELCIDYERLDCSYWMFNKEEKQCSLYESMDRDCSFVSGPELPSIESCLDATSSTSTSTTTTTKTTTFSGECDANSDCSSNACDTTTNNCYDKRNGYTCDGDHWGDSYSNKNLAIEACNDDINCFCFEYSYDRDEYYTYTSGSVVSLDEFNAYVKT